MILLSSYPFLIFNFLNTKKTMGLTIIPIRRWCSINMRGIKNEQSIPLLTLNHLKVFENMMISHCYDLDGISIILCIDYVTVQVCTIYQPYWLICRTLMAKNVSRNLMQFSVLKILILFIKTYNSYQTLVQCLHHNRSCT